MIRVGLIGGRGYVGEELLRLFDAIPEYTVVFAGSRSSAGRPVAEQFPGLQTTLAFSEITPESVDACNADAWIIAQDNGQAASFASRIDVATPVLDISADFRFDPDWVYGLPPLNKDNLRAARRVANPGCYATAVQLAILPVRRWLDPATPPVACGVSGFSGAGRTPGPRNDQQRLADNLIPYALVGHGHEREITHHLGCDVRFSPHVAPFFRGISATVFLTLNKEHTSDEIRQAFDDFYRSWPLIDTCEEIPEIRQVRLTNRALVGGFSVDPRDPRRVTLVTAIDNLRKGAASQAIENLNLMFDLPCETGLLQ